MSVAIKTIGQSIVQALAHPEPIIPACITFVWPKAILNLAEGKNVTCGHCTASARRVILIRPSSAPSDAVNSNSHFPDFKLLSTFEKPLRTAPARRAKPISPSTLSISWDSILSKNEAEIKAHHLTVGKKPLNVPSRRTYKVCDSPKVEYLRQVVRR